MEQHILNLQTDFISLQNQYNQLYARGKDMQKKLLSILQSPPYNPVIKIFDLIGVENYCYLGFIMFGEVFDIYVECAFNESGRLTDGFLKTYLNGRSKQVIFSVPFDRIGNIDSHYNIDDFAVPYLMNVVTSYKKHIAELHLKTNHTILLKQLNP